MPTTHDNLLNRYLQAVGFWLPRGQKGDILAELREDLRSQIEDREEELCHILNESEIAAILKQRGRPELVAGSFLPQRSLIGPVLYPIYLFVLKIIALCVAVPWMISLCFVIFNHIQGAVHVRVPLPSLGTLWTVIGTQFTAVTLIFAAIERLVKGTYPGAAWDPRSLPKVKLSETTKRRGEAIAGIVFGILGFAWLLALPSYPFLLIGPAAYAVKPAPIWSTVYLPILILAVAGIAENAVILLRPHLAWFQPTFKLGTTLLSLWIVYRLLQVRTYMLPLDSSVAQYTAITNTIVQICVAGTGVGLAIASCFHAWRAFQAISRTSPPTATRMA